MSTKKISIIRWTARIVGLLLIALVVFMLFAEGIPNLYELSEKELKLFAAMVIMTAGLVIAYKREILGGIMATCGYVFFALVEQSIDNGPIFPIFFVVGALYLFCGWHEKKINKNILES